MTADRQLAARAMELDSHLEALLRYSGGFYESAIQHGMRASDAANAVAHIEKAARRLHALAAQRATPKDEPKVVAWMFDRRYGSGLSFVKPASYADEDGNLVHPAALVLNSESDAAIVAAAQRAEQAPKPWETCKHHGPAEPNVWACPTCLIELRTAGTEQAQGAEPLCWLRTLNGEPDWSEDCLGHDKDVLDCYSAEDGYAAIPLYTHAQSQGAACDWPAKEIASEIMDDLRGRSGCLDNVDDETRQEMLAEFTAIINRRTGQPK